ncbi:nuclear transport factor 2 family protein [Streptomyces sp. ACA25]|uniref:nuclear transport factor 2 family protein n=1 Tax=Streptomyces sp. ACA25 TaxID=3022596 RepID=UPI00230708B0|nr:nuclear transport factor 2 family protein [Streptomyces sp. ACA25]MDB1090207.1 nuclear transport factor 2 family protein [Streptomyces sp. ACA25]
MNGHDQRQLPPSSAITAVGVDHVRLSYHYLDSGDLEGYGSLLDENMQMKRPDAPPGRGRAEVLRGQVAANRSPLRHHIFKIVADGDSVVAMGHLTARADRRGEPAAGPSDCFPADPSEGLAFVDVFTLSDEGMLLGCRRFYYTAPGAPHPQ